MLDFPSRPPEPSVRRPRAKPRRAKRVERPPAFLGWLSSDAEEIERRRWRGKTEVGRIEALEPDQALFGSFRVSSAGGSRYEVEIRALDQPLNSCGCADHRVNGLGTCKHIEGVLAQLRRRGAGAFAEALRQGGRRIELFLPRAGDKVPRLLWPKDRGAVAAAAALIEPFLAAGGTLRDPSPGAVEALMRALSRAGAAARSGIRVSRHLEPWIEQAQRRAARLEARERFLADVAAGRETLELLRHPLLPYQHAGMLHLAFGERALLADDMGLGKTVQAIAAAELLRRLKGIARVLVVCPASLKGEWQEQVARFSGAATLLVTGSRALRLAQYAKPGFFTVVNYEQVVIDAADINRLVKPDLVILDEAQRIKNWQTKTARMVKSLAAPHAFVLTGTPIENRIDEIYSIVQYLDPERLGPLFRFNRDFYELDERGRAIGYKNLDELLRRLQPVMLRRRKRDVETELPGRTLVTYLLPMAEEQRQRYEEYKAQAARLIHAAQRRPLTQQEFERLQKLLACMRMLCDTPFILDPSCRVSPKLDELERVLGELLAEPERKVIVFSEWERMLLLVRELAEDMGVEFAWHTGSVPQERRRAEIGRFKRDAGCRLFLSTDAGSVGLNLQSASAVVNLDLPWNPAKLEQRIARAWRKNQMRTVDVVNLVTEDSIEQAMLQVLSQKQALADGVLDGAGELKAMRLPSGRKAFVARMAEMMAPPAAPAPPPPERRVEEDLARRHGDNLLLVETHDAADGGRVVLTVIENGDGAAAAEPGVEILDRKTYETVQRLCRAGVLQAPPRPPQQLFRSPRLVVPEAASEQKRLAQGAEILGGAERKLRLALLLAQGGFAAEAMPALAECLALAEEARKLMAGEAPGGSAPEPSAAPPPPRPLDEIAAAIDGVLGEIRHRLAPAASLPPASR
jgi:superfamily II DNA or RNA helicase